jgi:MerR family transcriptional regulator/heat shock protein HspR
MVRRREGEAVFVISIAAELADVHPQTLRLYERKGLIHPIRTASNIRLYSEEDIEKLKLIQKMTQDEGVNLAGVRRIFELDKMVNEMRGMIEGMEREIIELTLKMEEEIKKIHRSYRKDIVRIPRSEVLKYERPR